MKRARICLPIEVDQYAGYSGLDVIRFNVERAIENSSFFVVASENRIAEGYLLKGKKVAWIQFKCAVASIVNLHRGGLVFSRYSRSARKHVDR